jgi:hypothetical protein
MESAQSRIFHCNSRNCEYTFPRYGEILKIAETRTGRCSEWSMLFGAMLSSLGMKTSIVHDFLDHCWNGAMLSPDGQWVHIDSTLAATDTSGNTATSSTVRFTVDRAAPTTPIISSPADNSYSSSPDVTLTGKKFLTKQSTLSVAL